MIRGFLDLSGGHLLPETWEWLDTVLGEALRDPRNNIAAELAGGRTRQGWFVHAPENLSGELPHDLTVVLAEARRQGAEYVLLDCDALPMEDLPVLHPDFPQAG